MHIFHYQKRLLRDNLMLMAFNFCVLVARLFCAADYILCDVREARELNKVARVCAMV